jgi:hypothetical protein
VKVWGGPSSKSDETIRKAIRLLKKKKRNGKKKWCEEAKPKGVRPPEEEGTIIISQMIPRKFWVCFASQAKPENVCCCGNFLGNGERVCASFHESSIIAKFQGSFSFPLLSHQRFHAVEKDGKTTHFFAYKEWDLNPETKKPVDFLGKIKEKQRNRDQKVKEERERKRKKERKKKSILAGDLRAWADKKCNGF